MSFATIRADLAAGIQGFEFSDGKLLRCPDYVTDMINTPQAVFDFETADQIAMGDAIRDVTLIVGLFEQRDSERGSQIRLDEARDHTTGTGLPDVIQALDITGVSYLRYLSASRTSVTEVGSVPYLYCELRFAVVF